MISCIINGYENYELFRDGSVYSHLTKRILKQNYSKGYKYYIFVNNKKNRIENLRWASHSDNTLNTNYYDKPLKNIFKRPYGFQISFLRNKLNYRKWCKTEEQAILQRDIMWSMFS